MELPLYLAFWLFSLWKRIYSNHAPKENLEAFTSLDELALDFSHKDPEPF